MFSMADTTDTPKRKTGNKTPKASVWQPLFIDAFRRTGNVTHSAEVAGISRKTAYRAKENGKRFSDQWDEAELEAIDRLEQEARRRAERGVKRMKFYKGEPIMVPLIGADGKPVLDENKKPISVPYTEHDFSDTLLIFLLKARRPTVYRENVKIDQTTTVRSVPPSSAALSDEELSNEVERLIELHKGSEQHTFRSPFGQTNTESNADSG